MPAPQHHPCWILYAEDDPSSADLLKTIVEEEGHEITIVGTGRDFLAALSKRAPDLCLLDIELPDSNGLDLLRKVGELRPGVPAIMVTGLSSIETAVTAMKRGALDYITKPVDVQRFVVTIRNSLRITRQEHEIARLRSDLHEAYAPEHMVGSSPGMEQLRELIRKVASSDASVLITGESGAGKELVARALHFSSGRSRGPFIDVNSAALTESLLESELFGHEKGSFTGASSCRRGKFEQADGGTLFLDEIGDMPASTQAKVLRFLQELTFQRVGGDQKISVDVRVVCATNRDLDQAIKDGQFRQDLFYRFSTGVLHLPPLRERTADIPELARHFLARACHKEKCRIKDITPEALRALCLHAWPGNIRELESAMERAVLLCTGDEITPEHLPPAVMHVQVPSVSIEKKSGSLIEEVERLEYSLILEALERHQWNRSRAARCLGITPRMISYKMQNLDIRQPP